MTRLFLTVTCTKLANKILRVLYYSGSTLPIVIDTSSSGSGRHTVIISGSTSTEEVLAVGEATFTVPGTHTCTVTHN